MGALFALIIGVLVGTGVFLLLSRSLVRMVLGLAFLAYGVNLTILTVAGLERASPPLLTLPGPYVDPLPQALVLTAIVIGFATTALVLTVALRAYQVAGHEDVEAFGDNLARESLEAADRADPEHQGPDAPEWEDPGEFPAPASTPAEGPHPAPPTGRRRT